MAIPILSFAVTCGFLDTYQPAERQSMTKEIMASSVRVIACVTERKSILKANMRPPVSVISRRTYKVDSSSQCFLSHEESLMVSFKSSGLMRDTAKEDRLLSQ